MIRTLLPASLTAASALAIGAHAIAPAVAQDATRIAANSGAADDAPTGSVRFAAGDPAGMLLGHFNRTYGTTAGSDPHGTYYGKPGFILD